MFSGNPVKRDKGHATCVFKGFIEPSYYVDVKKQQQIQQQFKDSGLTVAPCHRQNHHDFAWLPDVRIVTVLVDDVKILTNRFQYVHFNQHKKTFGNAELNKILFRRPDLAPQLIEKDYKIWVSNNLLSNDIIFNLSWVHTPDVVETFCKQHKLHYNIDWINNIVKDMKQYV
jgi:hypothetical protein